MEIGFVVVLIVLLLYIAISQIVFLGRLVRLLHLLWRRDKEIIRWVWISTVAWLLRSGDTQQPTRAFPLNHDCLLFSFRLVPFSHSQDRQVPDSAPGQTDYHFVPGFADQLGPSRDDYIRLLMLVPVVLLGMVSLDYQTIFGCASIVSSTISDEFQYTFIPRILRRAMRELAI